MMKIPPHTTNGFIGFNEIDVSLRRKKKQVMPGGGFKWVVDRTLPSQKARFVHSGNVSDARSQVSRLGKVILIEGSLVFRKGADVQERDECTIDGKTWEVARVVSVFSTRAEVYRTDG